MEKACVNCFSAIDINETVCPYCGCDSSKIEYHSYALNGGTLLRSRYVIGKVIGIGGFGITYLCYDTQCGKVIAVKEYYPQGVAVRSADDLTIEPLGSANAEHLRSGIEKFLREGAYIARFETSSEIMGIYDVFEENGTAYYAMEHFNGITLKDYTDKYGRISAGQAVLIAQQISAAFGVIHDGGIIHRDVSPDNIMLCRNGSVRLVDFGAARSIADDDNGLSVMLKHGFTPLEQYQRNGKQGAWTDIYSLGASLYYALTLCTPEDPMSRFEDDSVFTEQLEQLPEKLSEVIRRACEVRAAERYRSSAELVQALSECGIPPCGFEEKRLRQAKVYPPRTELTYLSKSTVQRVKVAGEMMPIDLEELDLSDRKLTNAQIQNLRHFRRLRKLNLNNNFLTDLSCLSGLTELRDISFNYNSVNDIEFARNMDKLERISGENSEVSDISPLDGKSELIAVYFGDARVTDISPIRDCHKLEYAGFNEAQIGTVEALANKPFLKQVCLAGCGLRDISPLGSCPSLTEVYLGRNKLTDLSPLKGFTVEELILDNNMLSQNIESLAGITVLDTFDPSYNGLSKEQARRLKELVKAKYYHLEYSLADAWDEE